MLEGTLKRLSTGVLAASFAAGLGLTTAGATDAKIVAQATVAPSAAPQLPSADFGNPPSGEIPILFNDHHVYARPDRLTQNRVLAAIVRGNSILVPMRSIFEQMGATVSYNPKTKTVEVMKPGSNVRVTVGKPEVIINGESRPLDVAAEIYKGSVVVPLRVLSEGMGAYVQWLSDKRLVVVRYIAAAVPTPPPTPTAAPPVATPVPPVVRPTAAPTNAPKERSRYERFVVGDYIFSPKVYGALSPGNSGKQSFRVDGAVEFKLLNLPWMLEGDFRSYRYPHLANGSGICSNPQLDQSCANGLGQQGQVYVPSFQARADDFDGRFGLKIADPRIYIGVGYLFRNSNYEGGAFETQQHGLGAGLAKLPDLDQPFSIYGSVFYYPSIGTNAAQNLGNGRFGAVSYRVLKYAIGGTFNFGNSPIYLDFGYLGDRVTNKSNAYDSQHGGPYAGLGIHF
ncbi:MAG: hypothetical protein NVS3B16_13360 [Vulcanimicrobiaceae bacterium]